MPTKPANSKKEREPEDDIEEETPEETEISEEAPAEKHSSKHEEMKINFDYPHQASKQELGEDDENTQKVHEQVSNLDDLLEKTDENQRKVSTDEFLPETEEVEEVEDSVPVEESDEPVIARPDPEEEAEPGIRHIKHASFTRNIGDDDLPVNYQNAHFPHDNMGQNPIYAHQETAPKPKKGSKFYIFLLLIIGVLVVGGAVLVLKNKIELPFLTSKPSPTPEASVVEQTPQPSATPVALDRSKYKIKVLNGTTKTGLAASISAELKALGYQTDKTGNATNSSFTRTTIQVKKDTDGLLDQLITDLAKDYDATGTPTLKDSNSNDAEVILGTK